MIPDRLEYRKGATYVDSTLTDVLDVRAGVCQDFVHLGLNLLRAQGIAARYVSGYLYTSGDGAIGDLGDGAASVDPVQVMTLPGARASMSTATWSSAVLAAGVSLTLPTAKSSSLSDSVEDTTPCLALSVRKTSLQPLFTYTRVGCVL